MKTKRLHCEADIQVQAGSIQAPRCTEFPALFSKPSYSSSCSRTRISFASLRRVHSGNCEQPFGSHTMAHTLALALPHFLPHDGVLLDLQIAQSASATLWSVLTVLWNTPAVHSSQTTFHRWRSHTAPGNSGAVTSRALCLGTLLILLCVRQVSFKHSLNHT